MTQEDAEVVYQDTRYDIMCVFDGHGGDECSTYCAANFKDVFFSELTNNADVESALYQSCIKLDSMFQR